jgi:hypothetical protein
MKKLIVLVVIVLLAKYGWDQQKAKFSGDDQNPDVITHPTYAEVRINMTLGSRSLDGVMFAKTVNQADCEVYGKAAQASVMKMVGASSGPGAPAIHVTSSECKSALTPRNAKLFENQPTFVNYLALDRGDRSEREIRVIYWGITAEEGERVCAMAPMMQQGRKGQVTCIRSAKSS